MIQNSIERLEKLIDLMPAKFSSISEEEFSKKPAPDKWSKKEIFGHLVDSATNNHQRFVRLQFEKEPAIGYDGDLWVKHGYYQVIETQQLINFWTAYNKHLVTLMKNISPEYYSRICRVGENKVSLEFLMEDYVEHLEHHLGQILG